MIETWKPVPIEEFADFYEVSNFGRVRRSAPPATDNASGGRCWTGRVLQANTTSKGRKWYPRVSLYNNQTKSKKIAPVHRLVAKAFMPCEHMDMLTVNHKDGDKTNNHISNLEWVTLGQNTKHAIETGLNSIRGEDHPGAKLTRDQVVEVLQRAIKGERPSSIAKDFGVSDVTIQKLLAGETWHILHKDPEVARLRKAYKPRSKKGEGNSHAKLTEQDVRDIRAAAENGESRRSLSERYGMHYNTIGDIVKRKLWSHVD